MSLGIATANLDGVHKPFSDISLYNQAIDNDVRFLVFGFFKGFHRPGQVHNLTVDEKAYIALLLQSGQNDRQPLFRSCSGC